MNLSLSGVGADKKKIGILCGLLAVAAYFYFSNGTPSDSSSSQKPSGALGPATSPRVPTRQISRTRLGQARSLRNSGEFKPSLKMSKDEMENRNSIDPTLHMDLLAKLKDVKVEGGGRSIFAFGVEPAPAAAQLGVKEPGKIQVQAKFIGPKQPPPPPPPPPPPTAPPIPLKFYGFVNQTKAGVKRAFFLDGEDIIMAAEGQMVKNRYKIVRIGVNSAVVEDTQFENHQQTLPLVEEVTG
jgi:hypothetical protein